MNIFESIKMRAIVWVWKHTPNCADMSRLASRSLICVWCKRYFKQLTFLHEAAPHFAGHAGTLPGRGLSVEAKQRMVQCLQVAENKSS